MAVAGQEVVQLQQFLQASAKLLERVYLVTQGLSDTAQPVASRLMSTHYEIGVKLVKTFPDRPHGLNFEKIDRLGSEVLWREAGTMAKELAPLYSLLQDLVTFQERTVHFLTSLAQTFAPFSVHYTPELLEGYMSLFSAAVRLHLLAHHMPCKMLIQLYTVVFNIVSAQPDPPADPPNRQQLVHYVSGFDSAVLRLQSEFQPLSARIGQVLESTVFPALLRFGSLQALQRSGALHTQPEAAPSTAEIEDMARSEGLEQTYRNLEWMDKMRDWATWGLLVCPGELIRPSGLEACTLLLEEGLRAPVYREFCEWVHPLFEQHVRPTLVMHCNHVKKDLARTDRRSMVKSAKSLVEDAFQIALTRCAREHQQRRMYVKTQAERLVMLVRSNPGLVPKRASQLLAMLAVARDEVLWYFRHVGEVVPRGAFQSLLSSGQAPQPQGADPSVSGLLVAMQAAVSVLQDYRSAIQGYMVVCLRAELVAHISQGLDQLSAAAAADSDKELPYIVDCLRNIADHFQGLALPSQGGEDEAVADLSGVRGLWEPLAASLFTAYAPISAAELEQAAGSCGLLFSLASLMQRSNLIDGFGICLQRPASLSELSCMGAKLRASLGSCLASADADHVVGYLYALSSFEDDPQTCLSDGQGEMATRLTEELMRLVVERISALLQNLNLGDLAALDAPLTARSASDGWLAHSRQRPALQRAATRLMRLPSMQQALPALPAQPGEESLPSAADARASLDADLATLSRLAHVLSHSPPVRISSSLAVVPGEVLASAVRDTFKCLLSKLAFVEQEIQRPSLLEAEVHRFVALVQRLQPLSSLDLSAALREALLGHAYSDLAPASRPDGGSLRVIAYIAEWYCKNVVLDAQEWGVSASLPRACFLSNPAPGRPALDVALYASVSELGALVRVFGVYGARELGRRVEHPLAEALAGLDAALLAHEPMLACLMLDLQEPAGCMEAFAGAAGQVAELDHLLDLMKTIHRCLVFRQLLGQACVLQAGRVLPAVAHSLLGATLDVDGHRGPHICDVADLPRPSTSKENADGDGADPALIRLLAGDWSPERLQRWRLWPALLALTLWSPRWQAASFSPAASALLSNMDCLAVCAQALAAASPHLEAEMERVDISQASRVSLSTSPPLVDAQTALQYFVRCASYVLLGPGKSLAPRLLALDGLVGTGPASVDRELLESPGMPYTRISSAYYQACLHRQPGLAW